MISTVEADDLIYENEGTTGPQHSTPIKERTPRTHGFYQHPERPTDYYQSMRDRRSYSKSHSKTSSKKCHILKKASCLKQANNPHRRPTRSSEEDSEPPASDAHLKSMYRRVVMDEGRHKKGEKKQLKSAPGNVCNNSNGAASEVSLWDEINRAITPKEAMSTAAFIEQDVINKQRKEIMLLMQELSIRDQELNDLVRSHQSQVNAWEGDRHKLKDLQRKLGDYEKDLQRSDNELQVALEEMKKVNDQKEIDGRELMKTKEEMENLSKKIQENSRYFKEMEIQNKNLLDSVKKLVNTKENLESRGKDLTTRLKSKTGELNQQASEISNLKEQKKVLESQLFLANEKLSNFKKETAVWQNRYCLAKDESDFIANENKDKEEQIRSLTMQLHETLQQTLALQKALFTSCEREKCKEEILNSLRKQQKRTMQELANLRKLYERQTKDLTLYNLSVQDCRREDGDWSHTLVKEELETHGWNEIRSGGGDVDADFNKNMRPMLNISERLKRSSHHTKRPSFLNYDGRNDSSFLVKKKLQSTDNQASNESGTHTDSSWEDNQPYYRHDRSKSREGDGDRKVKGSEMNGSHTSFSANTFNIDEVKGSNPPDYKDVRTERHLGRRKTDVLESRNESNLCDRGRNRRRRLLSSTEDLNQSFHPKLQRSRSTSPTANADKGTSPINDQTNTRTVAMCTDVNNLCQSNIELCVIDRQKDKNDNREVKRRNEIADLDESKTIKQGHNETSGVYLSSSDCSTLSSPGQDKFYDELTPADSDGMCLELKRGFMSQDKLSVRCKKLLAPKLTTTSIHLSSSQSPKPVCNSHIQSQTSSSSVKKGGWNQNVDPEAGGVGDDIVLKDQLCQGKKEHDNHDLLFGKGKCMEDIGSYKHSVRVDAKESRNGHQNCDKKMDTKYRTSVFNDVHALKKGQRDEVEHSTFDDVCQRLADSDKNGCHSGTSTLRSKSKDVVDIDTETKTEGSLQGDQRDAFNNAKEAMQNLSEMISSQFSINHNLFTPSKEIDDGNPSPSSWVKEMDRQTVSNFHYSAGREGKNSDGSSKCVRIVSPQRERIYPGRKSSSPDNWRKHVNGLSTDSDIMPESDYLLTDSDRSETNFFKPQTNLTAGTQNPVNNCSYSFNNAYGNTTGNLMDTCTERKSAEEFMSRNFNMESGIVSEDTDGDMNPYRRREYFYQESLSSGMDSPKRNINFDDPRFETNAYVTQLPSTSSRPFTSARAPSLYKQLSAIHFCDKSKRYEWSSHESCKKSDNSENKNETVNQGQEMEKSSISCKHDDNRTGMSYSLGRNLGTISDSNNHCNNQLLEGESVVEDVFYPHVGYLEEDDFTQTPNTNMDKFHHHYNNIVRKLNISNNTTTSENESNFETNVYYGDGGTSPQKKSRQDFNTLQRLELENKRNLNETLFSLESDISNQNVEYYSVTGNDKVVCRLDFSDSTCIDNSNADSVVTTLPCKTSDGITTSNQNQPPSDKTNQIQPPFNKTNQIQPPSDKTNQIQPPFNKTNQIQPPSDKTNQIQPPSDKTNQNQPPSDKTNQIQPPSDKTNQIQPPSDKTNQIQPPSDKTNQIQPPSDKTNQIQPPFDKTNQIQPPFNKTNQIQPPSDKTNQIQPPFDKTNQIQPPFDKTNQIQPPSDKTNQIQPPFHKTNQIQPPSDKTNVSMEVLEQTFYSQSEEDRKSIESGRRCVGTEVACDKNENNVNIIDDYAKMSSGNMVSSEWNIGCLNNKEEDQVKSEHLLVSGTCEEEERVSHQRLSSLDDNFLEDSVVLTSLPDYFPDISSVLADDLSVEEEMRPGACGDGCFRKEGEEEWIEWGRKRRDEGEITQQCLHPNSKSYSQTSTPSSKGAHRPTAHFTTTNYLSNSEGTLNQSEEETVVRQNDSGEKSSTGSELKSESDIVVYTDDGDKKNSNVHADFKKETLTLKKIIPRENDSKHRVEEDSFVKTSDLEMKPMIHGGSFLPFEGHIDHQQYIEDTKRLLHKLAQYECQDYFITSNLHPDESLHIGLSKTAILSPDIEQDEIREQGGQAEKSLDLLEGHPTNFVDNSSESEDENESLKIPRPLSPASKLHHLLVESQEMIRFLEKSTGLKK